MKILALPVLSQSKITPSPLLSPSLFFFQLTVVQQQLEYLVGGGALEEEVLCIVLTQLEVALIHKSDLLYFLLAILSHSVSAYPNSSFCVLNAHRYFCHRYACGMMTA